MNGTASRLEVDGVLAFWIAYILGTTTTSLIFLGIIVSLVDVHGKFTGST